MRLTTGFGRTKKPIEVEPIEPPPPPASVADAGVAYELTMLRREVHALRRSTPGIGSMIVGVALGIWGAILLPLLLWIIIGSVILGGGVAFFSDLFDARRVRPSTTQTPFQTSPAQTTPPAPGAVHAPYAPGFGRTDGKVQP